MKCVHFSVTPVRFLFTTQLSLSLQQELSGAGVPTYHNHIVTAYLVLFICDKVICQTTLDKSALIASSKWLRQPAVPSNVMLRLQIK